MIETVARWKRDDRAALFSESAAISGKWSAQAIEKDYWIYWTLGHLFRSTAAAKLVFKGGTTLSKIHGIIERFSEDIDLSVDRRILGFTSEKDPMNASSRGRASKLSQKVVRACAAWVANVMIPELAGRMATELLDQEEWSLNPDERDHQTALLSYPPALTSDAYGAGRYIRPVVRLEFGARADQWPTQRSDITPYCKEAFPETVKDPVIQVQALAPERTFWEKVTLLHAEYHRPESSTPGERLSRHYYDVFMLTRSVVSQKALGDEALRDAVVSHKSVFFQSSWASYESARPGSFRLVPHDGLARKLRADYEQMREMFPADPPSFDDILSGIQALEERLNK